MTIGILALAFQKRRIPNFDSEQINDSAKTSDRKSPFHPFEDDKGLHYDLLSHSDHPITRENALAGCTVCQEDRASPLCDHPLGRIHGSRTSYPEEKPVRCLSAQ